MPDRRIGEKPAPVFSVDEMRTRYGSERGESRQNGPMVPHDQKLSRVVVART
jgi:hypothetical protein